VAKLTTLLFSLFVMGVAQATEIADAPIPEPNYFGIIVFLVVMVGGCVWFMWKVMNNKGDDKK